MRQLARQEKLGGGALLSDSLTLNQTSNLLGTSPLYLQSHMLPICDSTLGRELLRFWCAFSSGVGLKATRYNWIIVAQGQQRGT